MSFYYSRDDPVGRLIIKIVTDLSNDEVFRPKTVNSIDGPSHLTDN